MNELDTPQVNDLQNDDICTETDKPEPAGVTKADKLPQIMATVAGTIFNCPFPLLRILKRTEISRPNETIFNCPNQTL
jgi:hypothetical protein